MRISSSSLELATVAALALSALTGCDDVDDDNPIVTEPTFFEREDLVSDQEGAAEHTDPQLVNPWGIAFGPDSFFWVANNGTATSTLYDGEGELHNEAVGGPVTLPISDDDEGPTGIVFNETDGFQIAAADASGPSRFIFATAGGALLGWSPDVDARNGVVVLEAADTSSGYTGLAIESSGTRTLLYAADFRNAQVDVYDEFFLPASGLAEPAFVDPQLPQGYAPFGIQAIDGRIYVAYALQNEDRDEEVAGRGNGYVSVFEADGTFIARVASTGLLDAPWGMTRAPGDYGRFDGALLVGNFGDGHITAFDAQTFRILGQLESAPGQPIEIDGLWALTFGNDRLAGESDDLYFTAGPDEETHGVFGELALNVEGRKQK